MEPSNSPYGNVYSG